MGRNGIITATFESSPEYRQIRSTRGRSACHIDLWHRATVPLGLNWQARSLRCNADNPSHNALPADSKARLFLCIIDRYGAFLEWIICSFWYTLVARHLHQLFALPDVLHSATPLVLKFAGISVVPLSTFTSFTPGVAELHQAPSNTHEALARDSDSPYRAIRLQARGECTTLPPSSSCIDSPVYQKGQTVWCQSPRSKIWYMGIVETDARWQTDSVSLLREHRPVGRL